jgi:7-carboxy-7-deazaguanine synthase
VREIAALVASNRERLRHVVITGGEPLLQAAGVAGLCRLLREIAPFHVTVESNATRYDERVAAVADLMSLSPKLSTSAPAASVEHHARRLDPDAIQRFISFARDNGKDFQLKFVFAADEDAREIRELLASLRGWKNEDILLMPPGATPDALRRAAPLAVAHAIREGWRYCDRLHVSLFGNREGV